MELSLTVDQMKYLSSLFQSRSMEEMLRGRVYLIMVTQLRVRKAVKVLILR